MSDKGRWGERTCPVCGKRFFIPIVPKWNYKYSSTYLCSYTCQMKYSKKDRHGRKIKTH